MTHGFCPHCHRPYQNQVGATAIQLKLYWFIVDYFKAHQIAPSFTEMQIGLAPSFKSKNSLHIAIKRLEERGLLTRIPARARALMPLLYEVTA